jgi:hypothetical protein
MFACCYFDISLLEMHDGNVKIDGGNPPLDRQPRTLPGLWRRLSGTDSLE